MRIGKVMAVAMMAFSVVAGASVLASFSDDEQKELLEKTQTLTQQYELYDAKKMYEEAALSLKQLAELYPEDIDRLGRYIEYCSENNFDSLYYTACRKAMKLEPYNYEWTKKVLDYMLEKGDGKIYTVIHEAIGRFDTEMYPEEHKKITEFYNDIRGIYKTLGAGYSYVSGFREGYSIVQSGNVWRVLSDKGVIVGESPLGRIYSYSPKQNLIVVIHEQQLVYTDFGGARKRVPYNSEENCLENNLFLGTMSCGLAPVELEDGSWGYLTFSGDSIVTYYYGLQFASNLSGYIGTIKKDDKWAFFSYENGGINMLTGFDYDEVYINGQYDAICDGIAFARKSGNANWSMLEFVMSQSENSSAKYTANEIVSDVYTEVTPFNGYAGVRLSSGYWAIIDRQGNAVYSTKDRLGESGCGLTAFCQNDKWGYIDEEGAVIIKPQFDEAYGFNASGSAFVRSGDSWSLIRLNEYIYMED